MKTSIGGCFIALVIVSVMHQANASVTFAVTPSTISNTFLGVITLQVTGLSAGDTVLVQKFGDLNTNGVVDPADYLVQQFNLTDGQPGMVIGGVTNINVPGDTDTTSGQITAKLNFPDRNFTENIIAKYLLVLSSPAGHFSPITNTFNITNFPFGQSISGTVFSNTTPVPNATVILFPPPHGNDMGTPVAGTVANNAGVFSIRVVPGTYVPMAFKTNYVANYSASPVITLTGGQATNVNLTLTNTTASISGRVVDANNSSIGLPAIFLPATSTNGAGNRLIAVSFTDTNGNFNLRVGSGTWSVSGDAVGSPDILGYVVYDNNTNVNAGASGVLLPFHKATACFYGTVKDNLGNPLPGVAIFSSDNNGVYGIDGVSDVNGNYVTVALGGLSGDQWSVSEDFGGPANYIYSQGQYGITLSSGQAYHYNFTGIPAPNFITGNVRFLGTNIVGVGVNAYATINSVAYQTDNADTDTNGNYLLPVANGMWNVQLNCNGGRDSLDNLLGPGNYQCPNIQFVTITNNNGTANFTVLPANGGEIFGQILDAYGNPAAHVTVYVDDGFGDNYSTTTDGNGNYVFGLGNGNWGVSLDCGQLNSLNYQCVSTNYQSVSYNSVEADFNLQFITVPHYPFTTLHEFSADAANALGFLTNNDGASPFGGLLLMSNLLYGTTQYDGTNGEGTIFAVSTNLNTPTFALVHTFAISQTNSLGIVTNSDGGGPQDTLISSSNVLYGTAAFGGLNGNGTVFAVNAGGSGFRVIHTFTAAGATTQSTNTDGVEPVAGLVLLNNILYGTTVTGGTNGLGVVFAVNTNGTFSPVHVFSGFDPIAGTNAEGAIPYGTLILSGATLYGTADFAGDYGNGTIFKVNTNGAGFVAPYSFTGGNDGSTPDGGLVLSNNILYGTTAYGGSAGNGTVFALNTNGTGFTVLHTFTGSGDGANPNAGLILVGNMLYGTAVNGGTEGWGTVFAVNTAGTNFVVLHEFTGGNDGGNPYDSLVLSGNSLYGTASAGGNYGNGTVFAVSITPSASAPTISSTHLAGGQCQMLLNGAANQNYTLQMSTNLANTNWVTLLVTNNPATNAFLVTDPNATNKQRFYRILVGP